MLNKDKLMIANVKLRASSGTHLPSIITEASAAVDVEDNVVVVPQGCRTWDSNSQNKSRFA